LAILKNIYNGGKMKQSVIIDCDPGTDDAIALFLALNNPDWEILGITITGGNASLIDCAKNAQFLLDATNNLHIPVIPGANKALNRDFRYGYDYHGLNGMGIDTNEYNVDFDNDAESFITNELEKSKTLVKIIALGPLTNIAKTFKDNNYLLDKVDEFVVMGGGFGKGNITPYSEFNFYNDPEAASIVLNLKKNITLITLNSLENVFLDREQCNFFMTQSVYGKVTNIILTKWFDFRGELSNRGYEPCDVIAVAVAMRPDICEYQQGSANISCSYDDHAGSSAFIIGKGTVKHAVNVNSDKFIKLIRDSFSD
jgi:inosine-uridine nucleoside N-ribohydrolase